jgi:hypothetical protein
MKDVEEDRELETRSDVSSILPRTRYSPDPVIASNGRSEEYEVAAAGCFPGARETRPGFPGGWSDLVLYRIWPDRTSLQPR